MTSRDLCGVLVLRFDGAVGADFGGGGRESSFAHTMLKKMHYARASVHPHNYFGMRGGGGVVAIVLQSQKDLQP